MGHLKNDLDMHGAPENLETLRKVTLTGRLLNLYPDIASCVSTQAGCLRFAHWVLRVPTFLGVLFNV